MAITLEQYKARHARYQTRVSMGEDVYGHGWATFPPNKHEEPVTRLAKYEQTPERTQVAVHVFEACLAAGTSRSFAYAAVHHAFFESRWNPEAFHPGGKTAAQKEANRKAGKAVAIGLFQLTQTGIGKGRPYFAEGRKAGMSAQAKAQPTVYYDAQDWETNVEAWLSAVLRKFKALATNHKLTVGQAYEGLFWSPLGAGYRNKELEAALKSGT